MVLQIHPGNRRANACSVSIFGNSSKPGTSSSGARCCTVYVLHMCSKNFLYCLAYLSLHLQFSGPQQSHNTSIRRLQHPCSKAKRWKRMKRSWNLFCAQSPVVCEIFFT